MASTIKIKLPNGKEMPALGFGTWQATEEEITSALDAALEAGYRHIDCATVYNNEKAIGKTLKNWIDSGRVKREELFIVTKLPPPGNRPSGVDKWLKKSLKDLQLDYLDMYLIHTPFSFKEVEGDLHPVNENGEIQLDMTTDHVAVWKEMEKQVVAGRTRAIGLSNFNISQITRILNVTTVPVSNLQIELHVYFQQNELVAFCKEKSITVTAYSPLGSRGLVKLLGKTESLPDLLMNPVVQEIAKTLNKTCAQILLRHIIQKGVAAIPKSTTPKRIQENIQLFDWHLSAEQVEKLNNLNQGQKARVCDFISFFKGIDKHPEFPF
ncbi:1,5-anhydro-D-fructose reductase [Leptopilina heterotoma]|uniref:1,5-anhydro-D-fructose reductase n=1 Tax=Leptopilina heterotoma TaxID=63436 RepID=UPI001CAA2D9A|nr:1,5-anhydro-D-fructose reductase [Leptopilina heterotoma]